MSAVLVAFASFLIILAVTPVAFVFVYITIIRSASTALHFLSILSFSCCCCKVRARLVVFFLPLCYYIFVRYLSLFLFSPFFSVSSSLIIRCFPIACTRLVFFLHRVLSSVVFVYIISLLLVFCFLLPFVVSAPFLVHSKRLVITIQEFSFDSLKFPMRRAYGWENECFGRSFLISLLFSLSIENIRHVTYERCVLESIQSRSRTHFNTTYFLPLEV